MDNNFKRLFSEGEYRNLSYLIDAQLLTDDGWSFDVHRIILAKENMYFRALFYNSDNSKNTFHMHDITGRVLDQILYYLYTKTLPDNGENNWELLIASDFFLVDNLKLCIKKQLMGSITLNNSFLMYMVSLKINDAELLKFSYRYIQTHFQVLISSNLINFEDISFEFLKNILNDSNLYVTGEHTVWECIENWVNIDPVCRLSLVPDLLKCLKTAEIDDSLANEIIRSDIICRNPLYKDLIDTQYLSQSNCSLILLNKIIQSSTGDSDISLNQFQSHRHPKCLHVIGNYKDETIILYITYDENIDLWRRLGEIDDCSSFRFLIVVGLKVYIMKDLYNRSIVFDICTKQWNEMLQPRIVREDYLAVKLGNRIFIIAGTPEGFNERTTSVEFYDTEQGTWFDAMPMLSPVLEFAAAVSYQNKIFVFGGAMDELHSMAQVYDADLNMWSLFTPPNTFTTPDNFIEYHGKLYVIAGSRGSEYIRKVEVFDIATDSWDLITDLPAKFTPWKAIVLQDQLIVFDLHFGQIFLPFGQYAELPMPPITWNEEEGLWKPLDQSFLRFKNCFTDSIDFEMLLKYDVEIRTILNELRDPATSFEESSFD